MRIIIEGYQYKAADVKDVLQGIDALENVEGSVIVNYVGYYYNSRINDCVFILPKVLLDDKKDLVFGEHSPEEIINLDVNNPLNDFIYEFAVWIYRTIVVFKDSRKDSEIVYHKKIAQVGKGSRRLSNTFLDILLEIIRFNRENQNFFFFILRNIHSGYNKINWNRTISTTNAIIQDQNPVYLNPVNKKRQINFDEELLVIFFSILNYIGDFYGFPKNIDCNFNLITGKQFETYLKGLGKTRLLQIKYKYFSDKALELWDLCFAFFDKAKLVRINSEQKEYLLVKNFDIVFEAIIDELIGDNPLPDGMNKKQEDGKIVDHLFTAKSLIENDNNPTYYIGDSKYYKIGNSLSDTSIYKQYTYARNVIQWNLDIFNSDKEPESGVKLRDDLTEGYNIIPNFFISSKIDKKDLNYGDDGIIKRNQDKKQNRHHKEHFDNRLFDRDTLLLFHYDVNFLFIISLYARNNSLQKSEWKNKMRDKFREDIQNWLQEDYDFYAMKSRGNALAGEQFVKEHFKELQGKIFRPYDDKDIFALALEKHPSEDNTKSETYSLLQDFFEITKLEKLGNNPKEELEQNISSYQTEHPYNPIPENWLPEYHVERYLEDYFIIGIYHDQQHWDWITGKNDRGSLIYNVRLSENREGSMPKTRIRNMKPKFAILYEYGHEAENRYHVFRIHDFAIMTEKRMIAANYPTNHGGPKGDYFIFRFDEEVSIGHFDISSFISMKRINGDYSDNGAPIYAKGKDLLEYISQ